MVRALSRGRFDHRSPGLESPTTDAYRGDGVGGSSLQRSLKKTSYTPRAMSSSRAMGSDHYAHRSPGLDLDRQHRSLSRPKSRPRFGRESSAASDRDRDYHHHHHHAAEYDTVERRNPSNEGRSPYGPSSSSASYGRSSSALREQRYGASPNSAANDDDVSAARDSIGGGSSSHARDVLSKMRGGRGGAVGQSDRGVSYTGDSGGMPPLRGGMQHHGSSPRTTRRRGYNDDDDDGGGMVDYAIPQSSPNRYEMMGMKEELKKKEDESLGLRRAMDAQEENLRREMSDMASRHEDNVSSVRAKLVATFKEDMQEMKSEWEEAFQRLKDESDAAQRAAEMELDEATRAKADLEAEANAARADHRSQLEEEKARSEEERARIREEMEELTLRSKEQLGELKAEYRAQVDELKRSKEEDLERLRSMYEEHLETTKNSGANVENELKEEIHVLLEENEKVKMCYENLEAEASRCKGELDDLNSNYQKALGDNLRWEKEAASFKEELNDVLDENNKLSRQNKDLEDVLSDAKKELEHTSSQLQLSQAERARFEKEFDEASKERDEAAAEYSDLLKKLDGIQEERTLESRYTEALVNQRDNMNAIIENSRAEIEELKELNAELRQEATSAGRQYATLAKEFGLPDGDAGTLREELAKAQRFAALGKEFRLLEGGGGGGDGSNGDGNNGNGGDLASVMREELARAEGFSALAREFRLPRADAAAVREELVGTASALRDATAESEGAKARLEALGRERERYNATVKALKYDLKALHGSGGAGPETSLQEHMRLLNEKWDENEGRVKQNAKLKSELEESIQLLEENAKEREEMTKEHHSKTGLLQKDLRETQTALVKMERDNNAMGDRLRTQEELEAKCEKLMDRMEYLEQECQEKESRCKSLDDELEKACSKKSGLEDALDKMEDVKKGLKKKLESAYFDLEETQRELQSMRHDHEDEMQTFEAELSKLSKQKDLIASQEQEIKSLRDHLEEAQAEAAESFKVQFRLLEEKHEDQERANSDYLEQKHKESVEELRAKCKHLERAAKEQKESLDQKSMAEIKRRGEFAKQKQELEILRSKERHLETHVNQLEEHISNVVADYEAKLQSGNITTCSSLINAEEKAMKKHVRELEKKLEVSSAAMKQIGKSSLLMEKENERLKHDKNELKLKLKKLVDCAEKFSPK